MPRRIVVLLLLAGVLAGMTSAAANASSNVPRQPKIIGGHPDRYNDTRWVASVKTYTKHWVYFCGGSLIGSRYVLTAAHCERNDRGRPFNRRQFKVRVGSKRLNSGGVVRGVRRIFEYPHYDWHTNYGDLAVLKLSRPVRSIRPVSMVPSGFPANVGDPAYIAGWGERCNGGCDTKRLYSTSVWLRPDGSCSGVRPRFIGSVMICAGAPGRGTCHGDSGGPLAMWDGRWRLVGATSYGPCTGNSAYAWVGSPRLHRWLTGS